MHGGGVVGPPRCAGGNDLPLAAHGPARGAQDHRGPPRPLARPAAGRHRSRQTPSPRPPAADAAGEVEVPHPEALPAARPNLLYRGVVMTGRTGVKGKITVYRWGSPIVYRLADRRGWAG